MDRRENLQQQQKKIQVYEPMLACGGFIAKEAKKTILSVFAPPYDQVVEKYAVFEPGISRDLAIATNWQLKRAEKRENAINDEENIYYEEANQFMLWEFAQNIRMSLRFRKSKNGPYYEKWDLSKEERRFFEKLSPLELRVFYQIYGLDGGRNRTLENMTEWLEYALFDEACKFEWLEHIYNEICVKIQKEIPNNQAFMLFIKKKHMEELNRKTALMEGEAV